MSSYGVSRTPVREILKQLEKEGLVRISPNAGAGVADFSVTDVSNIYEIFITLEGAGARFACREASDGEIKKLEECQFMIEKAIGQKTWISCSNSILGFTCLSPSLQGTLI